MTWSRERWCGFSKPYDVNLDPILYVVIDRCYTRLPSPQERRVYVLTRSIYIPNHLVRFPTSPRSKEARRSKIFNYRKSERRQDGGFRHSPARQARRALQKRDRVLRTRSPRAWH